MYQVYLNSQPLSKENQIGSFSTMKEAESFVFADIYKKFGDVGYIRVNYTTDDGDKWFDYGSWSNFYSICKAVT
jgi:hypothetical protein